VRPFDSFTRRAFVDATESRKNEMGARTWESWSLEDAIPESAADAARTISIPCACSVGGRLCACSVGGRSCDVGQMRSSRDLKTDATRMHGGRIPEASNGLDVRGDCVQSRDSLRRLF
jgi:hypothetical protein